MPRTLEKAHQTPVVFELAVISIVMGPPSLLPLVVDTSEALVRSDRTLEVALRACHIERLAVGIVGRIPAGSGTPGHISLVVLC